jgi:hypothetical protein
MARRTQTKGACAYCDRMLTRSGMARHLASCEAREQAIAAAGAKKGADSRTWIHLQVQDGWSGEYWLQLEMDASASLKQLDSYLRAIWLECCGHLSQFSVGGWGGRQIGMSNKAAQAFRPGVELVHIYDFGTESVTLVKVLDERNGPSLTKRPIALMARNEPPKLSCIECDKAATHLCMECLIEDQTSGTLCEQHTEEHEHDDYGEPVEIVNSPRLGMCGYDGPADPPY